MPAEHPRDDHQPGRSRRALQTVRSQVQPGSFPMLLAALALLYVLNGVAVADTLSMILVQLARVAVVLAAVYVLRIDPVTTWIAIPCLLAAITLEVQLWSLAPRVNQLVLDSLTVALLVWVLVIVLREVFRPTTSERNAVIGALCGFLLILTTFVRLHGLIEALSPGAYHVGEGPSLSDCPQAIQVATFQYFSTITLTTVGFGDIVPATPAARLATGVEAIVGQIYLAVVIATLVSRVAARRA